MEQLYKLMRMAAFQNIINRENFYLKG